MSDHAVSGLVAAVAAALLADLAAEHPAQRSWLGALVARLAPPPPPPLPVRAVHCR